MRHPLIITALAAAALVACGDTTAAPASPTADTATAVVDTTVPDDSAGPGFPAAQPGEFPETWQVRMAGELELDDRGCWYLDTRDGRGLLIFPPGFAIAESGRIVVTGDGEALEGTAPIDVVGGVVVDAAELPGGSDGRWGNYSTFCGSADGVVVASEVTAAFAPTEAEAAELVAELALPELDVDWPCGFGFASSTSDERVGLTITPRSGLPDAGPVSLPDERFEAVVSVGSNLFVNHCDDVAEWFEPRRVEFARFEIVSGTFTYPEVIDEGCSGAPGAITANDLVVALPSGNVTLGPIEITNEALGCFAG